MDSALKKLIRSLSETRPRRKDAHILRFYSSYVLICDGKAIEATYPKMSYCPLAAALYKGIDRVKDKDGLMQAILQAVNSKIAKSGHFTGQRELSQSNISIPYGASEMLMYALRKKVLDAACVVCDGAGTVIVAKPDIVQGIGARMNGLFYTSPILKVITRLEKTGSHVVFKKASIDQVEGVKRAAKLGYKKIAVTVNASMDESFKRLREIERGAGISLTILAVCTTGISKEKVREIAGYADLVWSCASSAIRSIIGPMSVIQLSKKIPVFVLTKKGTEFVSSYSSDEKALKNLDLRRQYMIAASGRGKKMTMGDFEACIYEAKLPLRDGKEPKIDAV
ncbi:MAG: DUF2099 family protein [Candidatus Omnitrophica bacterium]|nr:DUF2099 family protein [Candidatus Omnitrophota bacterium]